MGWVLKKTKQKKLSETLLKLVTFESFPNAVGSKWFFGFVVVFIMGGFIYSKQRLVPRGN